MILNILSILLFILFLTLGVIHFYWAFGGEWALQNAIPTKEDTKNKDFRPSTLATILVGLVLTSFSTLYLFQNDFISIVLPKWTDYLLWIIPTLFLLRAIGDFKYVGFFRSIKNTLFAKWDKKRYTPLCLFIGALGWFIYFSS